MIALLDHTRMTPQRRLQKVRVARNIEEGVPQHRLGSGEVIRLPRQCAR